MSRAFFSPGAPTQRILPLSLAVLAWPRAGDLRRGHTQAWCPGA